MPTGNQIAEEIEQWVDEVKRRYPELNFVLKFKEEGKKEIWFQLMLRDKNGQLICESTNFPVNEGWIPVELFWLDPRRHGY